MASKLFALAGFTALTGLVFTFAAGGCSSSSSSSADTGEAGTDAKKDVVKSEAGDEDAGPTTCPDTTPITSADIDSEVAWKGPAAIQDVCTAANINTVQAAFDDKNNKTYTDVANALKGLPAACLSCIVSDKASATWGPLVKIDATNTIPNFGACFAAFPGSSTACGKSLEYLNLCINAACADCTDQTSFDTCNQSKGTSTACAGPIKDFQSACTAVSAQLQDDNSDLNKACNSIVDAASTLCHGGVFDGGSVDAAGQ